MFIALAKLVATGRLMDREEFLFKKAINQSVPAISVAHHL
jgi:hypothetical protein